MAFVAGLALLTTACSDGATGTPTPATTTTGTKADSSTTPATTSPSDDNALADVDPCDLLTSAEVTQVGLTNPGEPEVIGGAETCRWKVSGNGGLLVAVNPRKGFDDLDYRGKDVAPTKVGKYEARLAKALDGAKNICHVVIEVSGSSSVQLISNFTASSSDTAGACARATQAAELVAPKLP
ncbi:DUF3558 domain-containing protein [Saccharothrix hoggarensis]|uniref:DUF3558 domain-containing protein n=1 Tax=Saccharothrix hoggarensis TaxID=913853 RepID=A0ABW3QY53_9PSEU